MKAKMVYLTLSSRANKHLQCWPSLETIAKESSCGVSSVKAALKELRDLGLIHWTSGPSRGTEGKPPNVYQLGQASISRLAPDTAEYQSPGDLSISRQATMNDSHVNEKEIPASPDRADDQPSLDVGPSPVVEAKTPRRRPATALPRDWMPSDGHKQFARENDLVVAFESEAFRDHALREDARYRDWDAAFRTWLRNQVRWAKQRQQPRRMPQRQGWGAAQ